MPGGCGLLYARVFALFRFAYHRIEVEVARMGCRVLSGGGVDEVVIFCVFRFCGRTPRVVLILV